MSYTSHQYTIKSNMPILQLNRYYKINNTKVQGLFKNACSYNGICVSYTEQNYLDRAPVARVHPNINIETQGRVIPMTIVTKTLSYAVAIIGHCIQNLRITVNWLVWHSF